MKDPLSESRKAADGLAHLFVDKLLKRYGEEVVSVVLFGSLARGCIHKTSDIDLLVVMKHAKDRLLLDVEDSEIVSERRRIYEDHGVYLTISPYVLSTEEAKRHRPVYLDLVAEGEVLLDREGFMAGVFDEMRSRMKEMGTKRVFLPDGSWYWVLKPDLKFGEEVEI